MLYTYIQYIYADAFWEKGVKGGIALSPDFFEQIASHAPKNLKIEGGKEKKEGTVGEKRAGTFGFFVAGDERGKILGGGGGWI